jgi:hypothetical protein
MRKQKPVISLSEWIIHHVRLFDQKLVDETMARALCDVHIQWRVTPSARTFPKRRENDSSSSWNLAAGSFQPGGLAEYVRVVGGVSEMVYCRYLYVGNHHGHGGVGC